MVGTYLHTIYSLACQKCKVGQYQSQTARTSCDDCQTGTYSKEGMPSCEDCEEDKYSIVRVPGGREVWMTNVPDGTECLRIILPKIPVLIVVHTFLPPGRKKPCR